MSELDVKLGRIRELLNARSLDALLLQQAGSFAWATCGAPSYIDTAVTNGAASLLFTPSGRYIITDNIEAPRLMQELSLEAQGWELRAAPWFEMNRALAELAAGQRLAADGAYPGAVDVSSSIVRMRAALTPEEIERFAALGKLCAAAMQAAIRSARPGMTEHEIAACLAAEAERRGMQSIVNLVGTDDRIFRYRHPLPTDKKLERYAMLVLCGRKWGLVCSLTRLIHFGRLPAEVRKKADATAQVDARFIAATRPGRKLGDIFNEAVAAYQAVGFPGEWRLHHQGGLAGYAPREIVATPQTEDLVAAGQVYAWNPSITGAKSEDSILVGDQGNQVLTEIPGWPAIKISFHGQVWERPAILEME